MADIGIKERVLERIAPTTFENGPGLWIDSFRIPLVDTHKYRRGHAAVFSGGPQATGAARLAAAAAARAGAGAVTLLSPASALQVNAAHLGAIMLRRVDNGDDLAALRRERSIEAYVLGPGLGVGSRSRRLVLAVLAQTSAQYDDERAGGGAGLVLDADALTSFEAEPQELFAATSQASSRALILTPHEGEFKRLFPDLGAEGPLSKLERARAAAARAHAIIVYKGPDTVIAGPDGQAAINGNGTPWLATAGSGDVLAGLCAGLLAQGMGAFEAACAAVWMHAQAARQFGPGLTADDLPTAVLPVLRELVFQRSARTRRHGSRTT